MSSSPRPDRIDRSLAWRLVRRVRDDASPQPPATAADPPRPARHGGARAEVELAGTRLEVEPTGTWTASMPTDEEAARLFDLWLPLAVRSSFVLGQLGQSLDGRIATETGASHYVTGPEDIRRLHQARALADAVVVGAGTVSSDDPRLTVREVEGDNPVRVVIDPEARLDPQRNVFLDGAARTMLVRRAPPGSTRAEVFGGDIAVPTLGEGLLDLDALLDALRREGLTRILVEGGGITVSRFLAAGLLDRLHVTVAPMVIGSGRPSVTLDPIRTLREALRPPVRHFRLGDDVLFDLDLS